MNKKKPSRKISKDKRGSGLVRAIEDHAAALGLAQKETAKRLGFSEPYYALLKSGKRWFGSVSEENLKKIADFLDVSVASVFMLAEIITPDDFYRSSTIESDLSFAFSVMSKDKNYSNIMPSERVWDAAPLQMQLLAAVLYQELSGKDLIERWSLIEVVEEDNETS